MNFRLPKIHNALRVVASGANEITNYVHVYNETAIAFSRNSDFVICVNLREYIKSNFPESYLENEDEVNSILQFFNGRSFTVEFWKNFIETKYVSVIESDLLLLKIEANDFSYEIEYQENVNTRSNEFQTELKKLFKMISDNYKFNQYQFKSDSMIPGNLIESIYKCFGKELKNDTFICSQRQTNFIYHFCLLRRNFIFGSYIMNKELQDDLFAVHESLLLSSKLTETEEPVKEKPEIEFEDE